MVELCLDNYYILHFKSITLKSLRLINDKKIICIISFVRHTNLISMFYWLTRDAAHDYELLA